MSTTNAMSTRSPVKVKDFILEIRCKLIAIFFEKMRLFNFPCKLHSGMGVSVVLDVVVVVVAFFVVVVDVVVVVGATSQ